jgi:hypothetical protein
MRSSLLIAFVLMTSPASLAAAQASDDAVTPAAPAQTRSSAEAAFAEGDFERALSETEAALASTKDDATRTQLYLLRGRCHAALGDNDKASNDFTHALEHDPEAQLDPSRVRPALVEMLEGLKKTLRAELNLRSNVPGALVLLDGKALGVAPLRTSVPIGRHQIEVRSADGMLWKKQKVLIRALQQHELYVPLEQQVEETPDPLPEATSTVADVEPRPAVDSNSMQAVSGADDQLRHTRFFFDLKGYAAPTVKPTGWSGELGLGFGGQDVLVSAHGTFNGEDFGAGLRATARLAELASVFGLHGSLEVPARFLDDGLALGAGGAAGIDISAAQWLEIFLEGSYRYYFLMPTAKSGTTQDRDELFAGLGVRLFVR